MIQSYFFFNEGTIHFDDTKTVKELVEYAVEFFKRDEPLGTDIMTVYQCHHSKSENGWFTTELNRSCADEIEYRDCICFAYYMEGCFYYSEGRLGHHMDSLGNHPYLKDYVLLDLDFETFKDTVAFTGVLTMRQIINKLKSAEYIDPDIDEMIIKVLTYKDVYPYQTFTVKFDNAILDCPLTLFERKIPGDETVTVIFE